MFIARQTRTETCTLRTGFIRCRKRHSFPVRASCPQASDIVGGESSGGRGVSRTECTVFQFRLPLSTVYRCLYLPIADSRIYTYRCPYLYLQIRRCRLFFCSARQFECDFAEFFQGCRTARVFCAHDDGRLAFGKRLRYARDDLAGLICTRPSIKLLPA